VTWYQLFIFFVLLFSFTLKIQQNFFVCGGRRIINVKEYVAFYKIKVIEVKEDMARF